MAGNKGFRNLPKLARLKRGVSLPSTQRPSVSLPPRRKLPPSGETLRLEAFPPPLREFLRTLEALSRGQEIFLTGGLVRDAMLRRDEIVDADLVTQSDAVSVARKIADAFGGACFMLDEQRGTARALLTLGATSAQVDVANFRASTLEADLRARDFTINALAVELKPLIQRGRGVIVDPTGGLADLRRHRLRLCGPRSLHDDPLRALRAVRLSHQLQCSLETRTRAAVQRAAPSLGRVAWERIRDECLMILALSDSAAALRDLDRLGLLRVIIPEIEAMKGTRQPAPHRFTVWEHSLRTVASLDALLADLSLLALYSDDLAGHLREALGSAASRAQVLKLAGLLHDVAKPETRAEVDGRVRFIGHDTRGAEIAGDVAERLRLPTKATRTLAQLVRHHLRPMHLGQLESISRRARYRFARDLGDDAQDLLLLALADAAAVTGASPASVWRSPSGQLVESLLLGWKEDESTRAVPSLIHGEDVMAYFDLSPGPEVGRLLEAAHEAQALGLVSTKEDALAYLQRWRGAAREIP